MNEDCKNSDKEPTISSIDENVARLNGRLNDLLNNFKSATRGEQPVCEDNGDKESLPSASIDSISRRVDDAHNTINVLNRFMQRFHS